MKLWWDGYELSDEDIDTIITSEEDFCTSDYFANDYCPMVIHAAVGTGSYNRRR